MFLVLYHWQQGFLTMQLIKEWKISTESEVIVKTMKVLFIPHSPRILVRCSGVNATSA